MMIMALNQEYNKSRGKIDFMRDIFMYNNQAEHVW